MVSPRCCASLLYQTAGLSNYVSDQLRLWLVELVGLESRTSCRPFNLGIMRGLAAIGRDLAVLGPLRDETRLKDPGVR